MIRERSLTGLLLPVFSVVVVTACGGSKPDDVLAPPTTIAEADAGQPPPPQAILKVTTNGTPTTTEAGDRATFTMTLSAKPAAEVVVPLASATDSEIKVEPSALTFGPNDWDQPKTITLIGQNEDVDDGDRKVAIAIGPSTSTDAAWSGVRADAVEALNRDDDTAGIELGAPTPTSTTTESGTKSTFTVRLKSRPSANVTIPITSSVPTEGAVDKAELVFGPTDWMTPQTVTVTGQDDTAADLDKPYDVNLGKPQTTDDAYAALSAQKLSFTNLDDDTPGFFVFPPPVDQRFTTEAGGTTSFTVRLRSKPADVVTIPISSSKPAEGALVGNVTQLVFTPANFDQPQTVTVKGVDDKVDDGAQAYTIALGTATSNDADYQGKDPPDVDLTNDDNDSASIMVSAPSGTITTEVGNGFVTFTVKLGSEPTAPVTLSVGSTKPTEGAVDKSQLVFDANNWDQPQTVKVTGQQDEVDDGDQPYAIEVKHKAGAVTTDAKYAAIEPADIALTNSDDDTQGVTVSGPRGGTGTTEGGGFVFIDVVLHTKPTADVTIPVSIGAGGAGEAQVDKTLLTFTPDNWMTSQAVKVTGKNDDVDDGDQDFTVVFGNATGGGYNTNPDDVTMKNVDDDTVGIVQSTTLSGTLTEVGGQATFKVKLRSRPAGTSTVVVPITITSGNATRSPTSLTFTTANWDDEQEVTVTGGGDGLRSTTAPAVTIAVGPSTSANDPKYVGLSSAGYTNVPNASACGLDGTNASEGEECDDGNQDKCDGCESCLKRNVATVPAATTITVPAADVPAADTTMCVEAWARIGGGIADAVIASSFGAADDGSFVLHCVTGSVVRAATANATNALTAEAFGVATCGDGKWHHFAGCRDVAAGVVTMTVFFDGRLVNTSAPADMTYVGANANLVFGGRAFEAAPLGLGGAIDEVRVSSTLRYSATFTPPRRHTRDASTHALWHFDEGTGTTAASDSAVARTATLGTGTGWAPDQGYTTSMCQ